MFFQALSMSKPSEQSRVQVLEAYKRALHDLNEGLIRLEPPRLPPGPLVEKLRGRMNAMRRFLDQVGNPEKGLPVVSVVGTSGKGSVALRTAEILRAHGLKVGLHVSPYLQVATEKICVEGCYVSGLDFADLVDWVLPAARPLVRPETPASIHGMASIAMAMEHFRRMRTDVVVFEAGCGGRYDLSLALKPVVVALTGASRDHVESLGPSLEDIAFHKSGMIRGKTRVVTAAGGPALEAIFRQISSQGGLALTRCRPSADWRITNTSLALGAARKALEVFGMALDAGKAWQAVEQNNLPARMEAMDQGPGEPHAILDGAHNLEKISASLSIVDDLESQKGRRVLLTGFLATKEPGKMIERLSHWADQAITTSPRVYGKPSFPAEEAATLFRALKVPAKAIHEPVEALRTAISMCGSEDTLLITGSLYLAGEIRNRWYPAEEVLLRRTSWPEMKPKKIIWNSPKI